MSAWRLLFALVVVYLRKPWRARRYRQLLARIEDLEIGLGMREAPQRLGPGAKWMVDYVGDVRYIQPVKPTNYTQVHRAAVCNKHNLLRSAYYGKDAA